MKIPQVNDIWKDESGELCRLVSETINPLGEKCYLCLWTNPNQYNHTSWIGSDDIKNRWEFVR